MKRSLKIILALVIFLFPGFLLSQKIECTLKGTVLGRESNAILLLKSTEDPRFTSTRLSIKDGHFQHLLKTEFTEQYLLIFEDELKSGAMRPVKFFAENGTVEFQLHSTENFQKNVISGGRLNKEMTDLESRKKEIFDPLFSPYFMAIDSLYKSNRYYSPKAGSLFERMRKTNDPDETTRLYREQDELVSSGEMYTPEASFLNRKCDSIDYIRRLWIHQYIRTHPDILSFTLLFQELQQFSYNQKNTDTSFINGIFPLFAKIFPDHPYTKKTREMLHAIRTVHAGGHYVDFTAQTIEGKDIRLSDQITGRVALIDLWASWCGPCRVRSKSVIPVYEKYRKKGFAVVGVACEYKDTDALKTALEKDKYPWLNLVEMDNRNGIWNKYNIAGSGGTTFLVDSTGKIIAIQPEAGELDNILEQLLK